MNRYFHVKGIPVITAVISAVLMLGGCAKNPVTENYHFSLVSEKQEINMGKQAHPEIIRMYGYYDDEKVQEYFREIGRDLADVSHRPGLPYHFAVVDSPMVNAFALPGGYLYITRGIMAHLNSEAEFAGITGHELTHVTAKHAAKQISKARGYNILMTIGAVLEPEVARWGDLSDLVFTAVMSGYGRKNEMQADSVGTFYTYNAGYDPRGVPRVLEMLKSLESKNSYHGLFATHPETEKRIKRARDRAMSFADKEDLAVNRERYLRMIDGIYFGKGPKDGRYDKDNRVYRNLFYDIRLEIPEKYEVQTQYSYMRAALNSMYIQFEGRTLKDVSGLDEFIEQVEEETGLEGKSEEETGAGFMGLPAREKIYKTGLGPNAAKVRIIYAVKGQEGLILYGVAPIYRYKKISDQLSRVVSTAAPLTEKEKADIEIRKVKIVENEENLNWKQLGARYGPVWKKSENEDDGENEEEQDPSDLPCGRQLALFNGHGADDPVPSGVLLKVIVDKKAR